jgi:hypothetical protein
MIYSWQEITMLVNAGVNIAIASAVLVAAALLSRLIANSIARALTVMLVCISIDVLFSTFGLFVAETPRHLLVTAARLIESFGIGWFIVKISGGANDR